MSKLAANFFLIDSFPALGTVFWVECFDLSLKENLVRRLLIAEDLYTYISTFEEKFSRFKKSSLVTRLNKDKKVLYDEDLFVMLSFGKDLSEKTNTLFSLYLGNELIEKGYGEKDFQTVSFEKISSNFTRKGKEIFLEGGGAVDLGGVGKGYLIDLLANRLQKKWGVLFFLINGGGDMYGTTDNGEPLQILLEHPLEKEIYLGKIEIKYQGFAASSSFKRMWNKEGKEVNHFVTQGDEVWGASFVVAKNALIADALATCLLLYLPSKKEQEKLCQTYSASYMLIDDEGVFLDPTFPPLQTLA